MALPRKSTRVHWPEPAGMALGIVFVCWPGLLSCWSALQLIWVVACGRDFSCGRWCFDWLFWTVAQHVIQFTFSLKPNQFWPRSNRHHYVPDYNYFCFRFLSFKKPRQHLPKSRMCFSSLSFSSCDEMLAKCMPWYLQYCVALNQFACDGINRKNTHWIELNWIEFKMHAKLKII